MLTFGMGFKAQNTPLDITPPITTDWAAWDGASDGPVENIRTDGGIGAQDIAAVSDTEAVIIYEDSNDFDKWKAEVLDVNTGTQTFAPSGTNSVLTLSGTGNIGQLIERLTPTKFVAVCAQGTTLRVSLISKSGKVLTETATLALSDISYNFRHSLKRINDTQVAYHGRNESTKHSVLFVIDITSDVLTKGASLTPGTTASDKVLDYPDITRATTNSFWAVNQRKVYYCSFDGSLNITLQDTITLDASSTAYDDITTTFINETSCLVTYEKASLSNVKANIFSWNGSTISRGTESADIFGTDIFQGTGTSTELGNKQVMISGRQEDELTKFGAAAVLSVDESNNITISSKVTLFDLTQADHTVIDASPSGNYVFAACQDEETVPIQQIGTRILQGF